MGNIAAYLQDILTAGVGGIAFFGAWLYMISKYVLTSFDIPFL